MLDWGLILLWAIAVGLEKKTALHSFGEMSLGLF